MKSYELKDLETGKEYIVAYRNNDNFIPCVVKVVKEYTVKFIRPNNQVYSPLAFGVEYTISDFWHEYSGHDLFGNKFRMIWTFESFKSAQAWCEFEQEVMKYVENNGTAF